MKKKTEKPIKKTPLKKKSAAKSGRTADKIKVQKDQNSPISAQSISEKEKKINNSAEFFIEELKKADLPESKTESPYPDDDQSLIRGDNPMVITDHLDELRSRLIVIFGAIIFFTVAGLYFSEDLLHLMNKPFVESGHRLNIFTITGGFMLRLKASFGAAILISFPVIVFEIWRFIKPALSIEARFLSRITIMSSVLLFYGGIASVYFLILPLSIKVLLALIGKDMVSTIGADDYLTFSIILSLAIGVLCEFPIVIMVLTRLGIITPYLLIRYRKHAIVAIWIIAAVVTPTPDPLTLSLVSIPLMFFYEISILMAKLIARRKAMKQNG
jgi:sec-independent protein translocase protein TatC